ncbi:MAG: hypothetical protein LBS07_02115 [Prevotellaceae bacterium]|nr:hypothetical protein [Prevotellaceae bacterium]
MWAVTYAPHSPYGSSDKLYEITSGLEQTIRLESIGGTPANRLIHKESGQLFIGPYTIDKDGNVRALSYRTAPGRYTGAARHLTDPASKIYIATMEEGFYEVDVNTLNVNTLYSDDNVSRRPDGFPVLEKKTASLLGWHGKGLYSGQGVLIFSNNGEYGQEALERFDATSGALYEWDGALWKLIRRNQFTEITGPGGIYGNLNPAVDPVWTTGFDYKSALLGVRQNGEWHFFRLPKASYSYDGAHGWNTEWPRIRNIGTDKNPDYLMTMHGLFWRFPHTFSLDNTAGISPRSAYLKVIGDFTRWNGKIVFGCDDSAESEFLNTRKAKGNIAGPGQSNSNLWFLSPEEIDNLGSSNASGYVWLREKVEAAVASEAFLFAGWENRTAWIKNSDKYPVSYTFEVDIDGNNKWVELVKETVPANASKYISFNDSHKGEWIRVKTDKSANTSLGFVYTSTDKRTDKADAIFEGIAGIEDNGNIQKGLLYGMGDNRRTLGLLASDANGETGFYEIDSTMNFTFKPADPAADFIRKKMQIPQQAVTIDKGSVLIVDDAGRRWRLPLGNDRYTGATNKGELRICREVATERDLFNCHGTFYELPAENADGYAKIRPIASHNLKINDYASFRGLFIISGIDPAKASANPQHVFVSDDKKAAVWAGAIDDLWKLGKPAGKGGPWVETPVKAATCSDPYLFGFYDKRTLRLSHKAKTSVVFTVEIDPSGDGEWVKYKSFTVKQGKETEYTFPESALGRWIRFSTDKDVISATAWLDYK